MFEIFNYSYEDISRLYTLYIKIYNNKRALDTFTKDDIEVICEFACRVPISIDEILVRRNGMKGDTIKNVERTINIFNKMCNLARKIYVEYHFDTNKEKKSEMRQLIKDINNIYYKYHH
jgi:hypothetical protein